MSKVAIATWAGFKELQDEFPDDLLLIHALSKRGVEAQLAVWDDATVDWSGFDLCVVRSTWDYHLRYAEFTAWIDNVSQATHLWNPAPLLRWNTHKSYLRDLEAKGVPVVPTAWASQGSKVDLVHLLKERDWQQQAVVKPAVSASAYETMRVTPSTINEAQTHLEKVLRSVDAMVQPYLASVESYGERSLLFIAGELTHAVRRRPVLAHDAENAFKSVRVEPAPDEISLGQHILQVIDSPTLYARVDLARDDAGSLCLMELELVEPSLFLSLALEAVEKLADAIVNLCEAS